MPIATLPNPWYYLDNFEFVLRWVARRYPDLLSDDERSFLDGFHALPRPARGLLVRMVMRKGTLFRAGKLNYGEIGDTAQAAAPLIRLGWVNLAAPLTLDELFRLLTRTEIGILFGDTLTRLGLKTAAKAAQLEALREQNMDDPRTWAQWLEYTQTPDAAIDDTIYQICVLPLCDRLRLMFFGNLRQDWSEFVLADLGLYAYEQVGFPASARAFVSRQDIDDYLQLHGCREQIEMADDEASLATALQAIPRQPFDNEWLESRRTRLLFRAGQQCERHRLWQHALDCYMRSAERGARARQIRMLERLAQHKQALVLAREALCAPRCEAERQAVDRMLPRLSRLCGSSLKRRPAALPALRIDLTLPPPALPMRVEDEVRAYLHEPQAPAFYVENTLINSLFGLLCWDAIFACIPGAFFHPYQHGPADLLQPGFRQRRDALFAACLAQLNGQGYLQTIRRNYQAKRGLQSPFVYWGELTSDLLELALACIAPSHLLAVFSRMLDDIRDNRAGLPDLVQFWPDEGRYCLIEVKGPGDRLQDNQLRWLAYCREHGIDVRVCHVQRPAAA